MRSDLDRLCESRRVRLEANYGEARGEGFEGAYHNWRVTLKYRGRQLTTDFFGGAMVTDPSAADVLSSLLMDARVGEETFEDFCSDFGYEPDSRDAHKTWQACTRMAPRVRRLLGDSLELFEGAEH
jgi:hypothetical protein